MKFRTPNSQREKWKMERKLTGTLLGDKPNYFLVVVQSTLSPIYIKIILFCYYIEITLPPTEIRVGCQKVGNSCVNKLCDHFFLIKN